MNPSDVPAHGSTPPPTAAVPEVTDGLRSRALRASDRAFVITDADLPDYPIVWVNEAFTRMTGYTFEEVAGRNCRFLQGPETDRAPVDELREAVLALEPVRVEMLNYRKDGTTFWNEVAVSHVRDAEGRVTHHVGVQMDVTERVVASRQRDELLAAERLARHEAEQARARLALLSEVTEQLGSTFEVQAALERVTRAMVPVLADWCAVDLGDLEVPAADARAGDGPEADGRTGDGHARPSGATGGPGRAPFAVHRVAAWHRDEALVPLVHELARLDAAAADGANVLRVLEGGGSVLVERADEAQWLARADGDAARLALLRALDGRSGIVVALTARDAVLGALTLATTSASGRHFGPADLEFAEDLAARVALVVDNARLYQAEAAERRRAALLAEASVALSGSLDPDEVLDLLLGHLVPAVADWAVIHMPGADGALGLVASRHARPQRARRDEAAMAEFRVLPGQPGAAEAFVSGTPQLLSAITDEVIAGAAEGGRGQLELMRRMDLRSGASVPLVARGRAVGVLSVIRQHDVAVTPADVALVSDLALRGGLSWDNARLYEVERTSAQELQLALLPDDLPDLAGLSFASRYLAGAAGTQVGGDWYDVIPLPEGRAGIAVGDVMGRGLRAAAVMGQLRSALRSYAVEGIAPSAVLRRLDEFTGLLEGQHLTTCAYGVWDPAARRLTLSTAGHLPPLLVLPGQKPQFLEQDPGLPLGLGEDTPPEFSELEVDVPPGAFLLLYTDGLVEGHDVPVGDGMATIAAALADLPLLSAEHVVDTVLRAMGRDGEHDDDTAVLAILATGGSGSGPAGGAGGVGEKPWPPAHLHLAPVPESASTARRFLAEQLQVWGLEDFLDLAALLLSELVTNAVRHARTDIEVQLVGTAQLLRVAVLDFNPRLPADPAGRLVPDPDAEGGRGLVLLDALAPRWGSELLSSGKRVWFELDAPPRTA